MNVDNWALLWSQRRNELRIELLGKHVSECRAAYAANTAGDWCVLLVGPQALMRATACSIWPTLAQRAAQRAGIAMEAA